MQLARSSARKANHNHSYGLSFFKASKHDQAYAHKFVLGPGTWSIPGSSYKRWRKWNAKISSPPLNDALVQHVCLSCRIEVDKVCEREALGDVEITQIPSIVDWTPFSKFQEVVGLLRNAHVPISATWFSLFGSSGGSLWEISFDASRRGSALVDTFPSISGTHKAFVYPSWLIFRGSQMSYTWYQDNPADAAPINGEHAPSMPLSKHALNLKRIHLCHQRSPSSGQLFVH